MAIPKEVYLRPFLEMRLVAELLTVGCVTNTRQARDAVPKMGEGLPKPTLQE
jgi:hypothetical protein